MATEVIYGFMEQTVQWTFILICIGFWCIGLIAIWKWFIGVIRRMLRYLFPKRFRKYEDNDNA